MITKFETGSIQSTSGSKSGGNTIIYLLVGAAVVYFAYRFVIKPQMDKNKAEEK